MSRLILLTYVNRSGSTLLARLLDEYNDVGVTPEARIPDNIIHGPIAVDNLKEIESLLSRLYRDEKFSSWGIDRDVLGQRLSACTMPLKFEELLQVILNEYFGSESVKARIYKCGAYFGEIEAVLSALPQAAVIFVLRDPRAVFNSQRSSRESILQTKMAGNPLDTARSFKRASQIMNQYNGKPFFIVVRYEELVENAAGAVRDLLMTLDLDSGSTGKKAAYVEKIPDRQKHLHSNVAEGPISARASAWQQELSPRHIYVIERAMGSTMQALGYGSSNLPKSIVHVLYYYVCQLRRFLNPAMKLVRLLRLVILHPKYLGKDMIYMVAPSAFKLKRKISKLR